MPSDDVLFALGSLCLAVCVFMAARSWRRPYVAGAWLTIAALQLGVTLGSVFHRLGVLVSRAP